jgi:hypothetical protein
MKTIYKVALIVSLAVLVPSATVYAATVLTLTTPASVTVVLPPTLAMYDYSGTFPSGSCGTTPVTSIPYGSVTQGTSSPLYECLEDTGGTSYYITSNSLSTDLSSSVGSLAATYYLTSNNNVQAPPIFFTPSSEIIVEYDLTIASNAASGSTNFNIIMTTFSTSSG